MIKHRGFPSRMPSSDYHFTIRREGKGGASELKPRERYKDRRAPDRMADAVFLYSLIEFFGDAPFERGNLDAGRLSWLLGREVIALEPFDPRDYEALLQLDLEAAHRNFPDLYEMVAEYVS